VEDLVNIEMEIYDKFEIEIIVDEEEDLEPTPESNSLRVWLECYQYLKIFSIWGHTTLLDLKDDPDTYDHIASLWKQLGLSRKSQSSDQVSFQIIQNISFGRGECKPT
jgi:hypothetical protein